MHRLPVICLVIVVVLSGIGATAATTAPLDEGPPMQPTYPDRNPAAGQDQTHDQEPQFDHVEFHVTVEKNASARFTFRYARPLANDSERETFAAFADEFTAEETDLSRNFHRRATGLVDAGAAETGRNMSVTDFDRDAYVSTGINERGVVELSFRWIEFARTGGDRLVVGDVFSGGLYVGPDQRLVVAPGEGLALDTATPTPDSMTDETVETSSSVTWTGERQFADRHPRIVFTPAVETEPTVMPVEATNEPSVLMALGVGIVLLGLAGALVWWRAHGHAIAATDEVETAEKADPSLESTVSETDLLSDEDRVRELLESNGGRMKQATIVAETEWSKSKVSMLLSEMEEDGTISKLRVGRENIISLAGQEPDATRSLLDDGDRAQFDE